MQRPGVSCATTSSSETFLYFSVTHSFGTIIIQQGRTKIRIAKFIEKRIERVLCPAGHIRLAVQDLIHAVGNVLFVGKDMGKHVLDGPLP